RGTRVPRTGGQVTARAVRAASLRTWREWTRMNETMVTVVGNVATTPVYRESAHGPMARFRMAATPRRWDRERQSWTDGPTSFFTIWTTRQLASNVTASVTVGEPVIVQGRLRVRETERGGQQWTTAEIDAASVGHDLTRGTAAFRRVRKPVGTWPAGRPPRTAVPPRRRSGRRGSRTGA
ncbi:single-stranded DNA-binding protein, partial [Streptomyces sp. NEAU-PBA10]|uniref:single-stranded DNA-binding protein n=1 Tax=Streptomyces sp. NEAU-PBA10 TaxID=3438640 RepID=UPI003F7A1AF6